MPQQNFDFHKVGTVNIFSGSPARVPESKTTPVTLKLEESEKNDIANFCLKEDLSVSQFYREAGRFYRVVYPYKEKLERYWEAVTSLILRLP